MWTLLRSTKLTTRIHARKGFTLAEVLVTIAIIAVVAAVLLPVVTGQLRKGDLGRVTSDLTSLRTGVEAFLADVRRVPSEVAQLVSQPTAGSSAVSADINGDEFPVGLANRWKGPYIDKEQTAGDVIATGFGGRILNALVTETGPGNTDWVAVQIEGLTSQEFDDLDIVIDNEAGSTTGRFRLDGTIAKYLLMPIN
jgi:prepilin-type N-terminal cleavage/methylation domain-containing protein